MLPVLREHRSITIRDRVHGQGREGGSQVWASNKQSCLVLFWWVFVVFVLVFCFRTVNYCMLMEFKISLRFEKQNINCSINFMKLKEKAVNFDFCILTALC